MRNSSSFLLAPVIVLASLVVPAGGVAADDLEEAFGSDRLVSLATGRTQTIRKAPAVAVVITRDDIDAIGATTIAEALELVPGFHGIWRAQGYQYVFRGIRTAGNTSPDVLVMVDGIPQNDTMLGNQRRFIAEIPFQIVDRIEVIRGPYSAIYGQDAYSAVVNIVTFDQSRSEDLLQFRGGSESTVELRFTKSFDVAGGLRIAGQLRTTEGHQPFYEEDNQTRLDRLFGTSASLAPRRANTDLDDYNFLADLAAGGWDFRFRARGREAGLGIGVVGAFDPDGRVRDRQYNLSAHNTTQVSEGWTLDSDIHLQHYHNFSNTFTIFPPGYLAPGLFPEGVKNAPAYKDARLRLETKARYLLSDRHSPTIGFGAEYNDTYEVTETRNYIPDPVTGLPAVPLPQLTAVPGDEVYIAEADRELFFAYVDDQWYFAPDWSLTLGVRVDSYSDVGETVNPRVALVWTASPQLTLKALHGTGFRAPTFLELYSQNASSTGNPDLLPVEIQMSELALNYQVRSNFSFDLSLFRYEIDDLIGEIPRPPQGFTTANVGSQDGYGGEISAVWSLTDSLSLSGYFSHQTSERSGTNDSISLTPENKYFLRADWMPTPQWHINATTSYLMDFQRQAGDPRPPVDDYLVVNAAVLYRLNDNWSFQLDVDNLFDEDAQIPEDASGFDVEYWGRRAFLRATLSF